MRDRERSDSIARIVVAAALLAILPGATPRARSEIGHDAALILPGLRAPARIVTDRYGIPHIETATRDDLYLVWGFVTARDRLWQIEHNRRAASGRLSEWFGNRALRGDGGAQLFRFAERAGAIWRRDRAHPEVRMPLERYAAGINAYLALCRSGREPWPEEFRRLGKTPEDWKPEDSVLGLLSLGVLLDLALPELAEGDSIARNGRAWLERRRRFENDWTTTTIPDDVARRLYGSGIGPAGNKTPAGASAPVGEAGGATSPSLWTRGLASLGPWMSPASLERDLHASNVFAVGKARSASGAPMLANDVHLSLTIPGPLHAVHVKSADGLEAIGAAVPGLPAVVSGRSRRCAWGITSLSADVIDVYADTLSRDGRSVRWQGRWVELEEAPYTMQYQVVSRARVPVGWVGQKRRYSPHGPVVSIDRKRRLAYSARWAGRDQDISLARMIGLEGSGSAEEIAARFQSLVTPGINLVAADVRGGLVYQTVGAVPRRGRDPGPGLLPGDGRNEWLGLIAPGDMPRWQVPARGFVVNGNNLPVGNAYPEPWPRFDWIHDRAARMIQRLAADSRVTLADMRSVQNDVFSRGAERMLPRLLRCADSLSNTLSPRARAAIDTLKRWDYQAHRPRVGPTLYRAWFGAFLRRSGLEDAPGLAAASLDGRAPGALRDPRTGAAERPAVAVVAALELGLTETEKLLGPDLARWTWARAHRARFAHTLAWLEPTLGGNSIAADGDNSTPCVGRSRLPWDVHFGHGAMWRHLVDLAVADSSWGVVPPGNAGRGAHRDDQLVRWANHGYVPLLMRWDRIAALRESEWRLEPR